jgi:MFS family permease
MSTPGEKSAPIPAFDGGVATPAPGAVAAPTRGGLTAPLRWPLFRALWIASIASFVGTWMHDVGASWLMTNLTTSPALIALVPAAAALPFVILAMPAGALADVVDRRRLLIATQLLMLSASAVLGVLTVAGLVSAPVLLAATFALGVGTALNGPAWQAIVPELVGRGEVPSALALNGLGINAARAVGPALGGFVVAALGPGAAFLLNAASFVGVLVVLHTWQRPPAGVTLPAETLLGAIRAGARYTRHAPGLRAVLGRALAFTTFASALWALLPTLVRQGIGAGPADYGLLLAAIGAGAVATGFGLPALRRALTPETQVTGATFVLAAVLALCSVVRDLTALFVMMAAAGVAWMVALTALHAAAQAALASWVRGRGLAVHLLVVFGGLSGGSVLWGIIAERAGLAAAFAAAGGGMVVALAATVRLPLPDGPAPVTGNGRRFEEGALDDDPDAGRGPVLIIVEYHIDPASAEAFMQAMREVRRLRLRDGAFRWDLLSDPADRARYIESFLVDSWLEHLRQHERITDADRAVEERARRFHVGPQPPIVSHFIARDLPR